LTAVLIIILLTVAFGLAAYGCLPRDDHED